jgi:hypothetical protein
VVILFHLHNWLAALGLGSEGARGYAAGGGGLAVPFLAEVTTFKWGGGYMLQIFLYPPALLARTVTSLGGR